VTRLLQARLSRPRAGAAIVALSLVLLSPALATGLTADDHFHALVLSGARALEVVPTRALDMFAWADGDRARAVAMMEIGMTGWWTDPTMRMAYLRPLSVATHWLDHRLWPGAPWLMHAHSLLWFALALAGLAALYRRLAAPAGAPWAAMLALLLYAVDDAHAMTVAWVANRNALVALACAVPVLLLHDRAARDGDRGAGRAGPLAFAFALLAGEGALAIAAYLFAYALCVDPRGRRRALVALAPFVLVALAWGLAYRGLGFGAGGSGLVFDPGSEPGRYLGAAIERVPVLLLAQFAFPPSDGWLIYPVVAKWLPGAIMGHALGTIVALSLAFASLVRASPEARMWALGSVLACLPVAAQFPHDRLLLFVGVGGAPLVALFLARLWQTAPAARSWFARAFETPLGWACVTLHMVVAPLWLPLRALSPADVTHLIAGVDRAVGDAPGIERKTVVLMNPPGDYVGYVPTLRAATGRARPASLRWLATGASAVTVERVDATTLRVRPDEGFLWLASERMQRSLARPIRVGDEVRLSDLVVRVTEQLSDGRPAEILARFQAPLEDPRYAFHAWSERGAAPFTPPAVGERVTLPQVNYLALLPPYPGGGLKNVEAP
jgi:hypothetical protein